MSRSLSSVLKTDIVDSLPVSALAEILKSYGRDGDTMLVHITPEEVEFLKKMGGRGTLNPKTGVYEFAAANPSPNGIFDQPNVNYNATPTTTQSGGGPSGQSGDPNTLASGGFFGREKPTAATPFGQQGQNPTWGYEGQPYVESTTTIPMGQPSIQTPTNIPSISSAQTPSVSPVSTSVSSSSGTINNALISPTLYKQNQNPDFQQIVLNLLAQQAARYR